MDAAIAEGKREAWNGTLCLPVLLRRSLSCRSTFKEKNTEASIGSEFGAEHPQYLDVEQKPPNKLKQAQRLHLKPPNAQSQWNSNPKSSIMHSLKASGADVSVKGCHSPFHPRRMYCPASTVQGLRSHTCRLMVFKSRGRSRGIGKLTAKDVRRFLGPNNTMYANLRVMRVLIAV